MIICLLLENYALEQMYTTRTLIWIIAICVCTKTGFFSHICLYEIGFLPMRETSISHDHVIPRNSPLKAGGKRIHHEPVHAEYGNLTLWVGISTRDSTRLVPGCNASSWVRIPYLAWKLMMDSYILPSLPIWILIFSHLCLYEIGFLPM